METTMGQASSHPVILSPNRGGLSRARLPNPTDPLSTAQITLELYTEHAPKTCRNFYELAKRGYYSGQSTERVPETGPAEGSAGAEELTGGWAVGFAGTVFHRIINDFMIQGERGVVVVREVSGVFG